MKETPGKRVAVHLFVSGLVQGVGFRFFAQKTALQQGVFGWVRNLPDGRVEAQGEGPLPALERWIAQLRRGPSFSQVDSVELDWSADAGGLSAFDILS